MPGMIPWMMSSSEGFVADVIATESPSQLSPEVIQMTCAVTASVAFWFGMNSVADMRCAPSLGLADAGKGVSDEQIHHAPPTECGLDEHHPRRLRPDLADLGGERTSRSGGQRCERV